MDNSKDNDTLVDSLLNVDGFDIPSRMPVIPMRDLIVFPLMVLPMGLAAGEGLEAAEKALEDQRMVLLLGRQDEEESEKNGGHEFYSTGTVASIIKLHKIGDDKTRVIVQGLARARVESLQQDESILTALIKPIAEETPTASPTDVIAWMRSMRDMLETATNLGKSFSPDLLVFIKTVEEPGKLADLAAATLEMDISDAQRILDEPDGMERLKLVYQFYSQEIQVLEMQQRISNQARGEIEKSHKEFFLRQQLKAIQQELGDDVDVDDELEELQDMIEKAKMPDDAHEEASRQLDKLERMHPDSAEATVIRNYLEVMCDLPWSRSTKDRLDLKRAREILDEDHFDLEKIKERILEHLGVMKLRRNRMKGPILCFVGPPGVGKTSLGRSIARALGRKFHRLSLGGVRDEAEVRGHRRTYVGAMPGRIIQGLSQVKSNNPVFMMDEVDKIGADFRGDPSSALLEVLDPEQNHSFRDNFLGVDFDLSKVMFILTANRIDTIQPAFRDRMEILNLPGYTAEEKVQIAKKYLIPRQRKLSGITGNQIRFEDEAINQIISGYTEEAGVRNLEREIASICRKVARRVAEGTRGRSIITVDDLTEYLGQKKIFSSEMLKKDMVGVSTGLAWTPTGGDVLFIETILMKGKGNVTLTGQLGDVMQESARAALSYLKAHAERLGLSDVDFSATDLHIHVPEGSIPKDGPSAGISMAISLISAFSKLPVKRNIAMTGEITLRGQIMPIGGVKEKVLAARRIGISDVVLPKQNERDLEEIQEELRNEMTYHFVETVDEVLRIALPDLNKQDVTDAVKAGVV